MTRHNAHGVLWHLLRSVTAWLIVGLLAPTFLRADTPPESALAYVSDYFSFIGSDSRGHVAFALDNNRGRDGAQYQAEHFVVLHDEQDGWIPITGNGSYDNRKRELARIPDSPHFHFHGTPDSGLTVASSQNQLTLTIDPSRYVQEEYMRARSPGWARLRRSLSGAGGRSRDGSFTSI